MKDQTEQSAGVMVATLGDGTAILLLRQADGSKRKEMVRLDSYEKFQKFADNPNMVACKWVPSKQMSYQLLSQSQCAGVPCVDRCVHPGCICDPDTNMCV